MILERVHLFGYNVSIGTNGAREQFRLLEDGEADFLEVVGGEDVAGGLLDAALKGFRSNYFVGAHCTGVSCLFFVSDVMRHAPPGARVGTLALDHSASAGTGGVNGSVHRS